VLRFKGALLGWFRLRGKWWEEDGESGRVRGTGALKGVLSGGGFGKRASHVIDCRAVNLQEENFHWRKTGENGREH